VLNSLAAIGHRIVHGGPNYLQHAPITAEMLAELRRIAPIDHEHLPGELALIEVLSNQLPDTLQVACFDTAFHRDLPPVAKTLPIPQKYAAAGLRRFGFHGLSFAYLMKRLQEEEKSARAAKPQAAGDDGQSKLGKVILAHLGNGCSMAAVKDGKCIDTTMGFTPTAGLVMGTRSGSLDPGALVYLMRQEKMDANQIDQMVNRQSGLLGVSGKSSDMRDLLAAQATDANAALTVDLFCYEAAKWIGALAVALEGLDVLVFAGGIGENAAEVREKICRKLYHLNVIIDPARNSAGCGVISSDASRVAVQVIQTDEELMIAHIVKNHLVRAG
jgi:acetate kinase